MAGGAARMSSAVRECHDLAQYSAGELTSQIFDAPTVQVLVQWARRRRLSTLVMLRYTERLLKDCHSTVIYCDLIVSVLRSQQHDASVFRWNPCAGELRTVFQFTTVILAAVRKHFWTWIRQQLPWHCRFTDGLARWWRDSRTDHHPDGDALGHSRRRRTLLLGQLCTLRSTWLQIGIFPIRLVRLVTVPLSRMIFALYVVEALRFEVYSCKHHRLSVCL